MIDDAGPWKCELLRACQEMEDSFASPDLFPEAEFDDDTQRVFLVERAAFLTAFAVRKLSEAGKVSVQFLSRSIPLVRHPIIDPGLVPEKLNQHRAFDLYKEEGAPARQNYKDFADLLIHSWTFTPVAEVAFGQERPIAFAVTSDRTRDKFISVYKTSDLVKYVHELAADGVVAKLMLRDGQGRYVEVGSNSPLTADEFEKYSSQAGRAKARQDILDAVFGTEDNN